MRRILLLALIAVGLVQAGTAQAKPAGKSQAQPKQVADTVEVEARVVNQRLEVNTFVWATVRR